MYSENCERNKRNINPEIMFVKRQDSDRRLGKRPDPPGLHHPW